MNHNRVVITGMGTVNPLGHSVEDMWSGILNGKLSPSPIELFDASTYPTTFAAQVKDYDFATQIGPEAAEKHKHAGRHCRFALGAARQAWTQSGLGDCETLDLSRLGVYLGSGEGNLDFENFFGLLIDAWKDGQVDSNIWSKLAYERMDVYREVEQESNMVVSHIAAEFGACGPGYNVLTACAASTQAIGEAFMQIRHDDTEVIITGGAHSMIHPLGVTGFNRLTALSVRNDDIPTSSRPFDLTRDGFVIGEGASILIMESYEHAKKRGAKIYAEILGYGSSADAYRITDQDPEGDGAASSMRAAFADANVKPEDISYISAHGTGTKQNDQVETRAVKSVFGDYAPKVPMSSVKSMLGHLIAAAGATELITCILALRDQVLPPTANQFSPDPDCDMDNVPNVPRKADVKMCLSNSFGFGGQNNSLIIVGGDD